MSSRHIRYSLPIRDTIGWTSDIGTEVIRQVEFRVADKPRAELQGWMRRSLRCRLVFDRIAILRLAPGRLVLCSLGRPRGVFGCLVVGLANPAWPTSSNVHARRRPPPHGGAP